MKRFSGFSIAALFILVSAALSVGGVAPEGRRKVYAHYYGAFPFGRRALALYVRHNYHRMSASDENKDGNPIRGMPLHNRWLVAHRELSPDESADLAIRRAMRAGIDGFAVNAWCGGGEGRRMLHVLMRVAKEKDYPFDLTVALDPFEVHDTFENPSANPTHRPERTIERVLHAAEYLTVKFGDHPNLARRDGRPLIFLHNGALLAECYRMRRGESGAKPGDPASVMRHICRDIEQRAGRPLHLVVDPGGIYPGHANADLTAEIVADAAGVLGEEAEGLTVFDPPGRRDWVEVGKSVRRAGIEWCYPVFYQYENIDYRIRRHALSVGGDRLRGEWRRARESGASLVLLHSWNDYRVRSQISPTFSHNYAPLDLTGYFSRWWKQGRPPEVDDDRIYCLYRRYPPDTRIAPFPRHYPEPKEGALEVLTILTAPGRVVLRGRGKDGGKATWEAPAGLSFRQFPLEPGPVEVELVRGGETEESLSCPEWITDRPFRQDNSLVAFSTEYTEHWRADWERPPLKRRNQKPIFYGEYADADEDGLPNWFEMLYFGRWNDAKSQRRADPAADPDRDGGTNLQEYRARTDPTKKGTGRPDPSDVGRELGGEDADDGGMLEELLED